MSEADAFRELIKRVRAGDAQATEELVREYEPAIRLAVHVRLTDPALRRVLDSMDICQSVLASFFVRVALGQYQLETPEQILRLLVTMARNKVVNQAQQQRAARRDLRRLEPDNGALGQFADQAPSPSQVVAGRELLQQVHAKLSPEEKQLADRRARGCSWKEIAAEVGGEPNTLRMRLGRAFDRVSQELGLEN
jgi:RNA polymerase sigma factor (sigma-70 family)